MSKIWVLQYNFKNMTQENQNLDELNNEETQEIEVVKTPVIPAVAKFTRAPAFVKWNNFSKSNQNNFSKPVIRKSANRWR